MPLMNYQGRVFYDEKKEALFTNWTCSGFSFGFKGKSLKAKVVAIYDQVPDIFNQGEMPKDWPCIGVNLDGGEELINRTEVNQEEMEVVLFQADETETHEIKVVKLSENARGKIGFVELEYDGEIYKLEDKKKLLMEVIGDSITCGFGNEAENNGMVFRTSEENGWMSYGAIAARKLGVDISMICQSGISAVKPEHPMFEMSTMEDIYEYTDFFYQRRMNQDLVKAELHNDIVVINLGTNDSNPIRFYREFGEVEKMEVWFEERYYQFIKQIRQANGPDTVILAGLGSMDYYLYHRIVNAVKRYQDETHDEKIHCFEFVAINIMTEGYGAMGHPSMKTHIRMGNELAEVVKKYCGGIL